MKLSLFKPNTLFFKLSKAFTLIELLIVIVIIGVLATSLIPRVKSIQAQARDTRRIADMKAIQNALALYHADHGSYPITSNPSDGNWQGNCSSYGSYPVTGPTGYIPNLAPQYISVLPLDPKPIGIAHCYLYKSDGKDYMFITFGTVEGTVPSEYKRPRYPSQTFAVYTPGAKNW